MTAVITAFIVEHRVALGIAGAAVLIMFGFFWAVWPSGATR